VKTKDLIAAILALKLEGVTSKSKLKSFRQNYLCKLLAEGSIAKKKVLITNKDWRDNRLTLEEVFVQ
jgi:hypothetical protein